ncbi:hypothetical protein OJ997_20760 [Solirubrobacter phytolaccae]|uniref:Uncharacterized protein n=1 Tax=Solirubrobacter phytolaccae TaxID=1404360 RepID=A0A9X3NEU0_9ACTN|nr:hypothetical protein [Solirubrobacter phytolaccae]MDA0182756.1 hypothetical protein [Solirubrobacter phytolaccae]
MRGLTLICAALCIVASPAQAKTYNGMAFAGPTISGDSVVWGTEYSDGSGAVKVGGRIVARFERMTGKGEKRQFGGTPGAVSASPTRMAYTLDDSRQLPGGDGDSGASTVSVQPLVSVDGSPFTNPLGCDAAYVTTAIDGDTVVLGVDDEPPCGGVYVDGRKIAEAEPCQVRIAGPYVAWRTSPCGGSATITVADRVSGAVVASLTPAKGVRTWGVFDLDESGNIVAAEGERVVAFSLADPRRYVLAKKSWSSTVATADGRAAFITVDENVGPERLLLTDLRGKVLERLDRYGKRRWPEGEIALTDRWVAWSVKRDIYDHPTGPGNVFLKRIG